MKLSQISLLLFSLIVACQSFTLLERLSSISEKSKALIKRKGDGGHSDGGSSGHDDSSGSGSSGSSKDLGSPSSNTGGKTSHGTGPQPEQYPDGKAFYFGGAEMPYKAGSQSPGGTTPAFMPASDLDFNIDLGFWPFGVYIYQFAHPYVYRNTTDDHEQTMPVDCLCGAYQECGCDQMQSNETAYIDSTANNKSMSYLASLNGKIVLIINGTLPNGTTVASAAPRLENSLLEAPWWIFLGGLLYAAVLLS